MHRHPLPAALATLVLALPLGAQEPDSATVRVVDVGAGLCTLTEVPPSEYIVFDAGHWNERKCIEAAHEFIEGSGIELMVISHSDGDHLGDANELLGQFHVHRLIHTGYERDRVNWKRMMDSVASAVRHRNLSVRSLATDPIRPGEQIQLGDATVTFVAGWHEWERTDLDDADDRNAVSIVARLDYAGQSVLFGGDAVGRSRDDDPDACKHSEAVMVDNHRSNVVSLAADVLIAPHHGANNANSQCFVNAVNPEWVVFSAGPVHAHPRAAAAERYKAGGTPPSRILRTDRGDDEDDPNEWWKEDSSVEGCDDERGDDDVEIVLRSDSTLRVGYHHPTDGC